MITVRFPSMLHARAGREVTLRATPDSLGALLAVLDERFPGLARELDDPLYNFAVNDEMLLHGVRAHKLNDGDVIEVVPTIAGGEAAVGR